MTTSTAETLNLLNRKFYEEAAQQFSETRQGPWEGWKPLVGLLSGTTGELEVLDIGCGNGRFGIFLDHSLTRKIAYCGTDVSEALLSHARDRLPKSASLTQHDFLQTSVSSSFELGRFHLVAIYGVLHHIYSFAKRIEVLRDACSLVQPGGLLSLSLWQWKQHPRLSRRIVPWPTRGANDGVQEGLQSAEPEKDDFLLRWGREGRWMRYCHHFSNDEVERLVASLGWECLSDTQGEGGLNRYLVLRSPLGNATMEPEPDGGIARCES